MAEHAIEIRDLQMSFGDKQVLCGLTFDVSPGEIVGYLGPNGAGKSTTMRLLTGQIQATGGELRVLGMDPYTRRSEVLARVAFVPEVSPLYDVLTALEHLELVASLRGINAADATERATGLLDVLGLGTVASQPLWTFSRGMRQRVAFASAFLQDSELLLLDEPLYGLDVQTVLLVKEVVRQAAGRGAAVVYCSHLLEVVEQLATRVIILNEGEIVADGSPAVLQQAHGGATLEAMFRELTIDGKVEDLARRFLETARVAE